MQELSSNHCNLIQLEDGKFQCKNCGFTLPNHFVKNCEKSPKQIQYLKDKIKSATRVKRAHTLTYEQVLEKRFEPHCLKCKFFRNSKCHVVCSQRVGPFIEILINKTEKCLIGKFDYEQ